MGDVLGAGAGVERVESDVEAVEKRLKKRGTECRNADSAGRNIRTIVSIDSVPYESPYEPVIVEASCGTTVSRFLVQKSGGY